MKIAVGMTLVAAVGACSVTPEPLSQQELLSVAQGRLASVVSADQEPVRETIGLYDAMARALKYNLDRQVELKEEALRSRELRLSTFELLPSLVASLDYTTRSNEPGSRSTNLDTGITSAAATRSVEQDTFDGELRLSWDVLDYGISYVRAQQAGDEVLIALEQRRAATNRIIEDTRTAYWRMVAAQRLLHKVRSLKTKGQQALRRSATLASSADADPRQQLEFQRDILSNDQALEQLTRDLEVAKRQLAALMNLPIGSDFRVELPQRGRHRSDLQLGRDEMILRAMVNRPELREISYRQQSNDRENRVATLEAIPGLNLFVSSNFSDNDLLENGDFVSAGANVSWNLLRLARLPERRRTIEAGGELLDTRALALTQAVALQVMVARARYASQHREFHSAAQFLSVQRRLTDQVKTEFSAGTATEQDTLNEEFNLLVAELRTDVAFADMQNAFANLYAAMGLDSYDSQLTGDETVAQMSAVLRDWWHARGDHTIQ